MLSTRPLSTQPLSSEPAGGSISITQADTSTATDGQSFIATFVSADTSAEAETQVLAASLSQADASSQADTQILVANISQSDTATASDTSAGGSSSLLQKIVAGFSPSAASHAKQYGSNTTTGSLLIAMITWEAGGGGGSGRDVMTVSDNINGTWTKIAGTYKQNSIHSIQWFYFANSTGGSQPTVTATLSGCSNNNCYMTIALHEYSVGNPTGVTVDNVAVATGTSVNPATGSIPVAGSNELVVAGFCQGTGTITTVTVASPFTLQNNQMNGGSNEAGSSADVISASSAVTATFTCNSSVAWSAAGVSFAIAGVGGPTFIGTVVATDTTTETDTPIFSIPVSYSDSGSIADDNTLTGQATVSDSSSQSDTQSLSGTTINADVSTDTETQSFAANDTETDSSLGQEAASFNAAIPTNDLSGEIDAESFSALMDAVADTVTESDIATFNATSSIQDTSTETDVVSHAATALQSDTSIESDDSILDGDILTSDSAIVVDTNLVAQSEVEPESATVADDYALHGNLSIDENNVSTESQVFNASVVKAEASIVTDDAQAHTAISEDDSALASDGQNLILIAATNDTSATAETQDYSGILFKAEASIVAEVDQFSSALTLDEFATELDDYGLHTGVSTPDNVNVIDQLAFTAQLDDNTFATPTESQIFDSVFAQELETGSIIDSLLAQGFLTSNNSSVFIDGEVTDVLLGQIKTIDGVHKIRIRTVNGVPIGEMKSWGHVVD